MENGEDVEYPAYCHNACTLLMKGPNQNLLTSPIWLHVVTNLCRRYDTALEAILTEWMLEQLGVS